MIRITGGFLRGRRLAVPDGHGVRPMPEMVRLALANSLINFIEDKEVLELFAGTGAMGFELVSRGAGRCTFVEVDPKHAAYIKKAASELGVEKNVTIYKGDAFTFPQKGEYFDIIFLGPPYVIFKEDAGRQKFENLLANIIENNAKKGSYIVAQVPKDVELSFHGHEPTKTKNYGINKLVFYEV